MFIEVQKHINVFHNDDIFSKYIAYEKYTEFNSIKFTICRIHKTVFINIFINISKILDLYNL